MGDNGNAKCSCFACFKLVIDISRDLVFRTSKVKVMSKSFLGIYRSYCVTKVLMDYCKQRNCVAGNGQFIINRRFAAHSQVTAKKTENNAAEEGISHKTASVSHSRTRSQVSKEVFEYFESKDSLKSVLQFLPPKILKRKRGAQEAVYVVDGDIAKSVTAEMQSDITERDVPVFEINPGIGLLSRELLMAGVQNLNLCEPSNFFISPMKALQDEFPDRVRIIRHDFLTLGKLAFQDNQDGGSRVDELFSNVPRAGWTQDPVMRIVGAIPSLSFIKYVIKCLILQTSIFGPGRPELYLFMSPSTYFYLSCGNKDGYFNYRSITVLFQLIFEWKIVKKFPRQSFLPWHMKHIPKKKTRLAKVFCRDPDEMYFVKIVPRRDLFSHVVKLDQLQPFWYFIWQHMLSRKNRVIPQLEKWVPGCGPRLIAEGLTIFTEFGDLSPSEILAVFRQFVSWPEFPDSPFLSSMEAMFMKMDQVGDDIVKGVEEDDDEEEEEPEDEESEQ